MTLTSWKKPVWDNEQMNRGRKGSYVALRLVSPEASPSLASPQPGERWDLFSIERISWVLSVATKRILLMEKGGWNASNTPHNGLGSYWLVQGERLQSYNFRASDFQGGAHSSSHRRNPEMKVAMIHFHHFCCL